MEMLLTWIILTAAAIGGVYVMWNKVIQPVARFVTEWPDAYKVLLEISGEFKPNDGKSLIDRIEVLENGQQDLSIQVTNITQQLEAHFVGFQPEAQRLSDG